ncbi:hypothetical protein SAMN05660462_01021 [Proteiniborus ethanoligenes]|uniref:Uncharacterized protein n=1 Tax=Proteiniborus ethanoligenes TaxID=415015 RepID=A0A1H3N643_9FIRM|nr:hypothetical protein [Proteiniborus ethanoligenes]TAH63256.1 MAG: hypothetical protein EWM50_03330 [Gottschalkiaceae bacterium]SDY84224.1 hypothetical protein SAMN05660462_01021 [Proteiniborus ethanoligenes]
MNKLDVLGMPIKEGLVILEELSDKEILVKEALANNKDKGTILSEPRIIRCTESTNSIVVVVSYF